MHVGDCYYRCAVHLKSVLKYKRNLKYSGFQLSVVQKLNQRNQQIYSVSQSQTAVKLKPKFETVETVMSDIHKLTRLDAISLRSVKFDRS